MMLLADVACGSPVAPSVVALAAEVNVDMDGAVNKDEVRLSNGVATGVGVVVGVGSGVDWTGGWIGDWTVASVVDEVVNVVDEDVVLGVGVNKGGVVCGGGVNRGGAEDATDVEVAEAGGVNWTEAAVGEAGGEGGSSSWSLSTSSSGSSTSPSSSSLSQIRRISSNARLRRALCNKISNKLGGRSCL